MSLPPLPGSPPPHLPPEPDHSGRKATGIVVAVLGVFILVIGVGILLCGGLGYVMTGTLDTGAGAMTLVGLIGAAVGVAMLAVPLLALLIDD